VSHDVHIYAFGTSAAAAATLIASDCELRGLLLGADEWATSGKGFARLVGEFACRQGALGSGCWGAHEPSLYALVTIF